MPALDALRSFCCVPARRRNLCGLLMLLIVDLIWVGSAGLTRYLFKEEAYDKPFFTVYFKTTLFTIYLVAFIFWRPWQRLCCPAKRKKEPSQPAQQQGTKNVPKSNGKVESSDEEEKRNGQEQAVCRRRKEDDCDVEITTSTLQGDLPSPVDSPEHCCATLVGPSQFIELKCSEDGEVEKSENRSTVTPCCRGRASCVRFSRRVEVKHAASPEPGSNNGGRGRDKEDSPSKDVPILTVGHVSVLALMFGVLWFFANYLYALALDRQSVATVNILSSLSGVFVLLLSAIPFPRLAVRDKFTLTKFVITGISVLGAVMVGVSDLHPRDSKQQTINYGALLALGGAALYAAYLVLLNKLLPHPDSLEIPMFFGFVGLFVAVLLAPLVAAWHFIGWELFQLPPQPEVWTLLLVNGFIGTVLSELLWLWGCLLTSSLVGTLSLSLVTPLSITYSMISGEIDLSDASTLPLFFIGALLIVMAFVCVALVEHFDQWDPIWTGIKRVWHLIRDYRDVQYHQLLSEESQQLIRSNSTSSHFNPLHNHEPACS